MRKYTEAYSINYLEGSRGIRGLEKILIGIGYNKGFCNQSVIEFFLSDNPGAIEALITWIGEQDSDEWKERIARK